MKSRLRHRLAKRKAARAEIYADVIDNGAILFRSNADYAEYLMDNGADPKEAWSIVDAVRNQGKKGYQLVTDLQR